MPKPPTTPPPGPLHATSNLALLRTLGQRVAQHRLQQGLSQAEVAERSGTSLRTITRLEAGQSVQLDTLLSVLRVLRLMDGLDELVPQPRVSPLALAREQKPARQRAPRKSARAAEVPKTGWTWGDEP
jgi:transcriptional regulator with XRE-family HTH domain